eukprot:PLAT6466.13.p1 GENE.PLAT6466.13~~PLAT6466.13.p1  ORF type:complete len:307 (+),score=137.39 PLAT6466.13:27-923(+)
MSFLGFGGTPTISIAFKEPDADRPKKVVRYEDRKEELVIFQGHENVEGTVTITVPPGKRFEHTGIEVKLIGQIELFYDRGNHYTFTQMVQGEVESGVLDSTTTVPFEFAHMDKQFESYNGLNVRLRYLVQVNILRASWSNISGEQDLWVQNLQKAPEINNSIRMEVGIEDCLHIEFEYNKSKYHLSDVVVGKVYFLLVRIKIKHMEVAIIRRESAGSGPSQYNESETLTKFEIMDGAPVRGESIPLRLFLGGYPLTPTYKNVNNKFSVKYFLNLVLVDEEDRRYFKQQEVLFWRRDLG